MGNRDPSTPSSSSSDGSRLPRGSACLNCKRRRVRCDGERPICGPCSKYRGHELDDCEFYEGQPSKTQILEEEIAEKEIRVARMQGLVDPSDVFLHDPQAQTGNYRGPSNIETEDFKTLPAHKIQNLLSHFGSFASEVGFFLDPDRFVRAALKPHDIGHYSRPCPSLLYAVCLWASTSFKPSIRRSFEETSLTFALRFVTEDLAGFHPQKYLHVMQAEVLLSTFFLNNRKMVEGLYHANAAASLAVSTKSNVIRSASHLHKPPGDAVDEGEWIDGFWTIVALSNYWVLVNENQTFTFYDTQGMTIDTPWPLNNYRQEKLIPASHKTLEKFLNGNQDDGYSFLALHTKASVLLKKAIEISQIPDAGATHQYGVVNRALEQMALALPRVDQQMTQLQRQRLAATHVLVHVAVIKLHFPRARTSNTSRQRCIHAAELIADISTRCPPANPLQLVNPIIGLVWYIGYEIVRTEMRYQETHNMVGDKRLYDTAKQILLCMGNASANSPLIASLVHSVRDPK